MLTAETAQVLIALITTGGSVAVAWFNYRSTRPPDPAEDEPATPRARRGRIQKSRKPPTKGS